MFFTGNFFSQETQNVTGCLCQRMLRLNISSIKECFNSVSSESFYPRWLTHLLGFTMLFCILLLVAFLMMCTCPCLMCWRISFKEVAQVCDVMLLNGNWNCRLKLLISVKCSTAKPEILRYRPGSVVVFYAARCLQRFASPTALRTRCDKQNPRSSVFSAFYRHNTAHVTVYFTHAQTDLRFYNNETPASGAL